MEPLTAFFKSVVYFVTLPLQMFFWSILKTQIYQQYPTDLTGA
jgi:hypothetical protein